MKARTFARVDVYRNRLRLELRHLLVLLRCLGRARLEVRSQQMELLRNQVRFEGNTRSWKPWAQSAALWALA